MEDKVYGIFGDFLKMHQYPHKRFTILLDVQYVTDMVSLIEGNVLIRCAIQLNSSRLDSSVVEHLAYIQGAWV